MYESQLTEKDQIIKELQERLAATSSGAESDKPDRDDFDGEHNEADGKPPELRAAVQRDGESMPPDPSVSDSCVQCEDTRGGSCLPSDAELDKFVTEVIDECVQSMCVEQVGPSCLVIHVHLHCSVCTVHVCETGRAILSCSTCASTL